MIRWFLCFMLLSIGLLPAQVEDFTVLDSDGRSWSLRAQGDAKAVVLVFIGKDCPIANRYLPRIDQLANDYSGRIVVVAVNPNLWETPVEIKEHRAKMGLATRVLIDGDQHAANLLGIDVTPTTVVIDTAEWRVRYSGLFDDNKSADLVKQPYVRDAIDAVLEGREIANQKTEPVGCVLQRPEKATSSTVNWAEHVAPILNAHCVACHRPEQVAPFSLLTFEDARRFARTIKNVTGDRIMPPWKAGGSGHFKDERILSDAEIATLAKWAEEGAAPGDLSKAPAAPTFGDDWMTGSTPDLVLETPEYRLSATGDDVYRCYVIDPGLTEDAWVESVEFRAGNPRIVHHIIAYLDMSGRAERLDRRDEGPGYKSGGTGPGFLPFGDLSGWAPGNMPYTLPEGIARRLPAKAKVVLEVHYHKNGREEVDRSRLGIWFSKKPVQKRFRTRELLNMGMRLPAGAANHRISAHFTVRADVHLWSVMPHMHLLGREARATATFPDGTTKELIHIPAWDFNWQDTYRYKEPLSIPKGTEIVYEAFYDNSASNPNNPNNPPKIVRWGEQTTDEMCLCYFYYTLDDEDLTKGDAPAPEDG